MTLSKKRTELSTTKPKRKLWVVVLAESGIPSQVEAYETYEAAEKREQFFSKQIDEETDAVEVFEVIVGKRSAK